MTMESPLPTSGPHDDHSPSLAAAIAARRQPPSSRDYDIYQSVHIENLSTREAAADYGISQTRVRQIVKRVAEWTAWMLPEQVQVPEESQARLARHITADRLQFVNQELMHKWRTTENTKFLGQTIRVSLAMARLGVVPGMIEGMIADAIEGPLDEQVESSKSKVESPKIESESPSRPATLDVRTSTSTPTPPPGDCSLELGQSHSNRTRSVNGATAKSVAPSTYAPLSRSKAEARQNFFSPLRTLLSGPDSSTVSSHAKAPLRAAVPAG